VARGDVDAVTFTSASTARSFFEAVAPESVRGRTAAASIGPITSAALIELGVPPDIEAEAYTIDGLVQAIARYFAKN
jgi:uroporphyrinogen III methyltransferase/synthase